MPLLWPRFFLGEGVVNFDYKGVSPGVAIARDAGVGNGAPALNLERFSEQWHPNVSLFGRAISTHTAPVAAISASIQASAFL